MAQPIYQLVAGAIPTVTTNDFKYGTTSAITLLSIGSVPSATNIITIRDEDGYFITVKFETLSGNTLSDLTYIEGDQAHTFLAGSTAVRDITKYDFDAPNSHITEIESNLSTHVNNVSNPHSVTKAQVGLGNVDNTADLDKPISTAMQTALDGKVSIREGTDLELGEDANGVYVWTTT